MEMINTKDEMTVLIEKINKRMNWLYEWKEWIIKIKCLFELKEWIIRMNWKNELKEWIERMN